MSHLDRSASASPLTATAPTLRGQPSRAHMGRQQGRHRGALLVSVLLLNAALGAAPAGAETVTFPERPPAGVHVVDEAGIIGATEAREIDALAESLLREHQVPLLVVTLRSLASRGASGYTIERYATELFNEWGIGSQERNYGMLLLVSVEDRRARIELGAAWADGHDHAARELMGGVIVPRFKADRYAEGVLAGVRGLDAMARGLVLPNPRTWWHLPAAGAVFLVVTAFVLSVGSSGKEGWAWALVLLLGAIALLLLSARGSAGAGAALGGGGSGAAFRGGSSRGGGATGRW